MGPTKTIGLDVDVAENCHEHEHCHDGECHTHVHCHPTDHPHDHVHPHEELASQTVEDDQRSRDEREQEGSD